MIQQVGLFPHRTIARNIATVPELLGWDRARTTRVEELMELVGLDAELARGIPPSCPAASSSASACARALAADPPVLLMDEPFGAVDPIVRLRLQEELVDLQRRLHKTIVFVTHDLDEAMRLGDRMAVLNVGGVLEQYGAAGRRARRTGQRLRGRVPRRRPGLKRLALIPVSAAELQPGPTVDAGVDDRDARAVMDARASTGWRCSTTGGPRAGSARAALDGHDRVDGIDADAVPGRGATRRTRCATRSTRW